MQDLQRKIGIYKGEQFISANTTLDGHLMHLTREEPLSTADMQKLMEHFEQSTPTPVLLTERVWFYINYHICLHGR